MIHHFDHRWATYEPDGTTRLVTAEEKADPDFVVMPRYWVAEQSVKGKLPGAFDSGQLAGYRWISNATNERTMIASRFPIAGVGNSLPILLTRLEAPRITAMLSTYAVDYCARQKLGGQNMTFGTVEQLPILAPECFDQTPGWSPTRLSSWIEAREAALSGSRSADLNLLRAELDSAFFRLYGIDRDDVDYIMDTFPIVKRKDQAEFGEYRTKRLILEIYDAMAEAQTTGRPYQSPTGIDSNSHQEAHT